MSSRNKITNPQETQQVAAHDEKWVLSTERVKISSTNIRLETTVPQKEETYQVVIDIIKNSMCFKAFTISTNIPKIFMQQLWIILDICPRVEGVDFTDVPYDDIALIFLIDLRYKGPLYKHTNMFMDHMHQQWRTLAIIINKCLSGNTAKLAKSIYQTEAKKAEAPRKVHATHARIMTESVTESAKKKRRSFNIMQAFKESKKTSRRQPGTGGSNEGTGSKPGVPDESTVISATLSKGTGIKPGVPDEEKDITEEKDDKDGDADKEGDDHISDTQDVDDEDIETKSDEDDIYKYKICVRKDEDEEMINTEVDDSDKGDEEITNAAKADGEKTSEVNDDPKKTELPLSSSSLSVSSGFGDQFLKLSSDSSLVGTVKDTTDLEINSLLEFPHNIGISFKSYCNNSTSSFVSTTPSIPQQTTTPIPTPTITTDAPTVTTVVPESNALTAVELRVAKLEKDMFELENVDHSTEALSIIKSQFSSVVNNYLGSKVRDVFQKELKKHTADLIQK
nr:hypothetical protein [Tanacetum cinerariifolium]